MNLAMNPVSIRVTQLPDGTLCPAVNGEGEVTVTFNRDEANALTATVMFFGAIQASLIYDQSGIFVISYHVTDPMATLATLKTIDNIIQQLNPMRRAL